MAEGHHRGYRIYAVTWFWLLVITLLEVAIVLVRVPRAVLVPSLVVLALMKAALIMAYFMHLAYERLALVYAVVVPMVVLTVVMFAFIGPDALSVHHLR
ncbi:MAG: cytochrome C oxidase subunit IV family protein [Armatimonadota bacterium]|nr:cytochrome C oxidase subunit IV family protein [Armatimonadota bacterium]MDR7534598.1 cytochrome C oxidase subunit IV family protein [Armatimonadota bacterium]MDR7536235.1 cytochrome C oxidase subunit IV family protein [Armatimonadota bacterium]